MIGYGPPGQPGQFPPRRPEEDVQRRDEEVRESRRGRKRRLWLTVLAIAVVLALVLIGYAVLHFF